MSLLRFLGSNRGRAARVFAGLVLVALGLLGQGRRKGLAVAGLVPLGAGAFDVCLLGPLARMPIKGKAFRSITGTP